MTTTRRGIAVLVMQLALVGLLQGRLAMERSAHPRVWARAVPVDPSDPFRGRYVRLFLEAADRRADTSATAVTLAAEEGQLVARAASPGGSGLPLRSAAEGRVVLGEPVAVFIPEDIPDPSVLEPGQELWVEVTVLRSSTPRPLRWEHRPAANVPR